MKKFFDVRFTEVVHRRYRLSILAHTEQEAIDLARSGGQRFYEEESVDSYGYSAEEIDDGEL